MKENNNSITSRSACAISMALEALGDKWSLLIIRDLMFTDRRSYGELLASPEGIATNILASRLVSLEENELIRKMPDPADSRRSLYYLTQKGIDLVPVITEIMHWMSRHNPEASACTANKKAYTHDRVALYKDLIKKLKKEHLEKGG